MYCFRKKPFLGTKMYFRLIIKPLFWAIKIVWALYYRESATVLGLLEEFNVLAE